MEEFLLIFRHEDASDKVSPEQMQAWMEQTMSWLDDIAAQDKLVSRGNGLAFEESKVVKSDGIVTDGPFGDIKETIGGYIMVRAESVDEAVEFAKGSPILQGEGNSVEVRKVAYYDGPE
ncbi:YciI family protein [Aliifodinibius sp. S!AR15-10]|uniref:YciI family protein n=1 Tax=Aliifodinibius sp. S!AR15-10 TaxID=2950437 RepID=UPI0028658154|nr:YciI family protein [Aliifodinibius sp. S!AR15-10]MDR8391386.1 YciI family protein [Aliifodinibius sp. S!AR15-10]